MNLFYPIGYATGLVFSLTGIHWLGKKAITGVKSGYEDAIKDLVDLKVRRLACTSDMYEHLCNIVLQMLYNETYRKALEEHAAHQAHPEDRGRDSRDNIGGSPRYSVSRYQ